MVALVAVLCVVGVPITSFAVSSEIGIEGCVLDSPWIDSNCTSNRSTARTAYDEAGNPRVELRAGYYNGYQYGWGRSLAGSCCSYNYFQVSFDGGKTVALSKRFEDYSYSPAYPASSDPTEDFVHVKSLFTSHHLRNGIALLGGRKL